MKISILQRLSSGKLVPADVLFPSMPCPEIKVTNFKIENLRKDLKQEYGYICDVTAAGEVSSRLCDVIPTAQGIIDQIRLYHNDGDQAFGVFTVMGNKSSEGSSARPFPFEGAFCFTATAVPVTDGNNTFRVVARDKVYGLDGFSLWAASFAFPYDNELDEQEREDVKEPTVTEGPQFVGGASGGEMNLYCIALPDGVNAAEWSLIGGAGRDTAFEFKALPGNNARVAVWPGTSSPAFLTVRPTMQMTSKVPSDEKMTSALASNPGVASLSPRERFTYGFAQGLGFEGYDLVFDFDKINSAGGRLTEDLRGLLITVELVDAAGNRYRGDAVVSSLCNASSLTAISSSTTPSLVWHFSNLFHTSDPMANEVVVSLLLGDLSAVGLRGVSIADWREHFFMSIAELLEELIKETAKDSQLAQGYYLGRGIADALRMTLDPTKTDRLDELGKAEFLGRLKKMPFFNPMGRGGIVLEILADFVERLKRFVGRCGR